MKFHFLSKCLGLFVLLASMGHVAEASSTKLFCFSSEPNPNGLESISAEFSNAENSGFATIMTGDGEFFEGKFNLYVIGQAGEFATRLTGATELDLLGSSKLHHIQITTFGIAQLSGHIEILDTEGNELDGFIGKCTTTLVP